MTTSLVTTVQTPTTANSTPANNYATLFFTYITQSLTEALATVRAVETKLPDEERVQACHILDFGLRTSASWSEACALIVALATYMERSGEWELWQQLLTRAIATAQQRGDAEHEITLTALLARLYQRRGEAAAMVRAYRRVIRLARRHNHRFELGRACSNLGYHYITSGYWWRAGLLSYYALAIFDELQSNHGRAHTHNHLGILFTRQYEWEKAKEHLLSACTIWQKSQDQYGLMRGHGNLGALYNEMANYEDAIAHSMLALELAQILGEEPLIGTFAVNISLGNLKIDNVQQAKSFADLAEQVFKKYADQHGLAQIAHTNGLIAIHEKNYLQAHNYVDAALIRLTDYSNLIQAKFTNIEIEIQLQDYTVAGQELDELEIFLTKHLAGNALQFYSGKLIQLRCYLAQARQSIPDRNALDSTNATA